MENIKKRQNLIKSTIKANFDLWEKIILLQKEREP